MKNNNFLIALAFCLGLSSAATVCSYPQYPQQTNPYQMQSLYPQNVNPQPAYAQQNQPQLQPQQQSQFPAQEEEESYYQKARNWLSPSLWWQSASSTARSAGTKALSMANAMKKSVGMENLSYKALGVALAGLLALGYKHEQVLEIVQYVLQGLGSVGTTIGKSALYVGKGALAVGSTVVKPVVGVVTNPKVAGTIALVAAGTALHQADAVNEETKKMEQAQQQQLPYYNYQQ